MVAPAVGWLAHESCSITGEMLISAAGRVARAYVAESPGVYRPAWTIEDVAEQIDAIRSTDAPVSFQSVPSGHVDHLRYSFEMATRGSDRSESSIQRQQHNVISHEYDNHPRGAARACQPSSPG